MKAHVVALGVTLFAAPAFAEDIAFVEASSELDDGKPATNAYNAVDGKPTTHWCTKKGEDAMHGALSFGFDSPVTVTHIGLVVGATKGEAVDKGMKRANTVYVADVEHRVEARFKDESAMQILELQPPAKGKRIVVEFAGVYNGAAGDAPLCISEVVLKGKGVEMTGEKIATKYRALNGPQKKLLHEWLDDVSAPQRNLLFNVDGTFIYTFEPLLEGKKAKVRGKWQAGNTTITFDVGGKTTTVKYRLTKLDEGDGQTVEMVIEGDPPHPSMAATFRPAPARLP
jgi:hypothetical protein